jgi:hypothetical protein
MTGHEFVIDGRPNVNVDWEAEYLKQRRSRLADSVSEYLEDDDVSILAFYNDLKDEIEGIIKYHQTRKDKAVGALELILGHRPVDFDVDYDYDAAGAKIPRTNTYEYTAHVTLSDIHKFQQGSNL